MYEQHMKGYSTRVGDQRKKVAQLQVMGIKGITVIEG